MSTKKVKDGTIKKPVTTTTRTKKPAEPPKKEALKTRKKNDEDEFKIKKPTLKPPASQTAKVVSRPAPGRKPTTTKTSSSRPVTPPSSRVTKTQFFPSKKMYSNALKPDKKIIKKAESPVVKKKPVPVNDVSPDVSSASERPGTATLRKGSIVNNNIAGPEVPKIKTPVKVEEPEYEDDFDSYESDFEDYDSTDSVANLSSDSTSTESSESESKSAPKRVGSAGTDDEKKLDSGNYELPEPRHRQMLDNIKESIEKENANLNLEHNRSNLGSLSDEGFEEGKSLQFINFLGAQKKYQHRKSVQMRRKRGEEILSMIRLDHYSFTLFELAPVPYDVFIKNFGRSNTIQVSTQTGEDDLNEEVQTDQIVCKNKWTQFPPVFTKCEENEDFWEVYKSNYLGVGGDVAVEQKPGNIFNESNLEKFLLNTGNLILNLQAESSIEINAQNNKSNIPFSKSYIVYDTHSVLKNWPIKNVSFCSHNSTKILTVHGSQTGADFDKSIVCVWSISSVEAPEMFLIAFGDVTCCGFSLECPSLIFGGLTNGSIVIWDTRENSTSHKIVFNEQISDILARSPTYSTEINYGHCSKLISIQSLSKIQTEQNPFYFHKATEICSLDEDGDILIWSVIFKEENRGKVVENQGLAHWGSVIIAINTKICLKKLFPEIDDFNCTDLTLSQIDSSNLYISTNYGIIIHCLASGGKTSVKKFLPETKTQANCLEMCPFLSQFFVAGFGNGCMSFYCRSIEKPLITLSNQDTLESTVEMVQWSHNRPFIFYTKDITNTVHIWNLKVNDLFPIFSIPFKEKIISMKLSPVIKISDGAPEKTYMMIAMDNGFVYLHLLNEEHDQQTAEEFEKDKQKFLNYINRYI